MTPLRMATADGSIPALDLSESPMNGSSRLAFLDVYTYIYTHTYIYIYGKCLGFARTRNDDGRRIIIIIIIINIMFINIIIIIIIIKPLLTIFNECRSLAGVGELNPFWRSSMNVEFNEGLTGVGELNPYWRFSMNVEV